MGTPCMDPEVTSAGPYLREVSHQVAACVIGLGHHVEEEGLHVVVERLMVQEEFGQKTQVLAVDL